MSTNTDPVIKSVDDHFDVAQTLLTALSRGDIFQPGFVELLRNQGVLPIDLGGLSAKRMLALARTINNTVVLPR